MQSVASPGHDRLFEIEQGASPSGVATAIRSRFASPSLSVSVPDKNVDQFSPPFGSAHLLAFRTGRWCATEAESAHEAVRPDPRRTGPWGPFLGGASLYVRTDGLGVRAASCCEALQFGLELSALFRERRTLMTPWIMTTRERAGGTLRLCVEGEPDAPNSKERREPASAIDAPDHGHRSNLAKRTTVQASVFKWPSNSCPRDKTAHS
jgi:hypothetical protein